MIRAGGLCTDFYALTMAQGYQIQQHNPRVVFDMFFRRQPFGGGFTVFAGLAPLLELLENFSFSDSDCMYLESLGLFQDSFLEYLRQFRFTGNIQACDEGRVVFPGEPLLRIEAPLCEAQLVESLVLNTINFQTLIATKAARMRLASNNGRILEFGLRRAQGADGAFSATRAAFIGGASGTSNTFAGKQLGIPVRGTMAHSWIMSYSSEREAFRNYADLYPESSVFLIDTYDTCESGIKNAIAVGLELKAQGITRFGVRLDSGDLEYLSKTVRRELDNAGLTDAFIVVSNDLTEEVIAQLVSRQAPIDTWGVGTHLVTGKDDPALGGVFKLAEINRNGNHEPVMKISDNPEKMTNPGKKQVYRFYAGNRSPIADLIVLDTEDISAHQQYRFYHPLFPYEYFDCTGISVEPLLHAVMENGNVTQPAVSIHDMQTRAAAELGSLDETYTRLLNPHIYKVSLSEKLKELKYYLVAEKEG